MIPFQTIDWTTIERVAYKGDTGVANWQTIQYPGLRIRLVEYSKDYLADHWCEKGHIVYCLSGEFETELSTGEKMIFSKDQSFIVSDKASLHLMKSDNGARLLIIDGDFLK